MVDAYLRLPPEPEHMVFQVRLGLRILGLAPGGCGAAEVARKMTSTAVASSDAYAAWELLDGAPHATGDDRPTLTAMVNAAELGRGDIPDLLDDLLDATRTAAEVMREALAPPG